MTSSILAATGHWTATGALPSASSWYGQHDGAVLLTGGKVLVVGGAGPASGALANAALFDPATGKWTATADLLNPRRLHTMTRLDDGKVLVTGGIGGSSAEFPAPGQATAEIYDPQAGTWKPTGSMQGPRWGHSAVLLPSKKVLVAGGATVRSGSSVKALRSAELYDPGTGKWTAAADMTDARSGHPAVVLGNGRVLVCGGTAPIGRDEETALAFCELYDEGQDAWTPTGSMLAPRARHQATPVSTTALPVPKTAVLVTGGSPPGAPGDGTFDPFSRATAELYDQATGAWTAAKSMPAGRGVHRAVPLGSGKVLVIGGADGVGNDAGFQSCLIYDSQADTWAPAGGLATGRWAFAATALSGGGVLVTGGVVRSGLAAANPDGDELTTSTEIFSLGGTP